MNVLGTRAAMSFSAEPDIKEWADRVALNPARIPPGHPASAALDDARERLATHTRPGAGQARRAGCGLSHSARVRRSGHGRARLPRGDLGVRP